MNYKRMNRLMIILCFYFFVSCGDKQIEFDQSKWNKITDGFYEYREAMVNDLMATHLKKGMSYQELTNLIGKPEYFEHLKTNTIGYTLMEDYGWDIDPVETKTLIIELSNDSIIQQFKVKHWEK